MPPNIETSEELDALCASISTDLLAPWLDAETLRATAYEFEMADIDCPKEILLIAAVLQYLRTTGHEHADELDREGFTLRADEARIRAINYSESYDAIRNQWS